MLSTIPRYQGAMQEIPTDLSVLGMTRFFLKIRNELFTGGIGFLGEAFQVV